jgi:hypothetical protein
MLTKTLLIMKFTAIFLLVACLHGSAAIYGQKVTLSEKDVSLQKVFRAIKKQTGFAFFFDEGWLEQAGRVTIHVKDEPLEKALDACFRDQPLTYSIIGKTVVIKKRNIRAATVADSLAIQPATIKGTVVDEKGVPLPGVSIVVKGTQRGTTTTNNGVFSIDAVPGEVLVFSMIGYKSTSVVAGNDLQLTVRLPIEALESSEVVVIGYGSTKKGDLSAAVSVVPDMGQIKNRPVMSMESMIQGKVPGVTSISNGGHPNSTPKITIRGVGSERSL